jgi:hypothetical protein
MPIDSLPHNGYSISKIKNNSFKLKG